MSEKLLDKLHLQWVVKKRDQKQKIHWDKLLLLPIWVFTAFIGSALLINTLVWLLSIVGLDIEEAVRPSVYNLLLAVTVYVTAIAVAILVPFKLFKQKTTKEELGFTRAMSWTDIGLAPLFFIAYVLLLTLLLGFITTILPAFPADQAQHTGFNLFGSRLDSVLAFMTLVALAPFAEEVLFRGYLYGKLKAYVPAFWGAVATSLLFGLVHFQWNVGVDVFILSMFLCWLRSLTGSIWASVLMHSLKNAVAYFILTNPLF